MLVSISSLVFSTIYGPRDEQPSTNAEPVTLMVASSCGRLLERNEEAGAAEDRLWGALFSFFISADIAGPASQLTLLSFVWCQSRPP